MIKRLSIVLTRDCNLRCKYCCFKNLKYSKEAISWDNIKKIIDRGLNYWVKKDEPLMIFFFGGEPFLYFNLIEKSVSYCRKFYKNRDIRFSVTTNGTLFLKNRIDFLYKNNFQLVVSLDGEQLLQDYQRPFLNNKKESSFRSIIKYLPYLVKYCKPRVNMVASPETVHSLEKNFDFLIKNNIEEIKIIPDIIYNQKKIWWDTNSLSILRKQCFSIIDKIFISKLENKKIHLVNTTINDRDEIDQETCLTNFRINMAIIPNGNVYICGLCFLGQLQDEERKFLLGNIMDEKFKDKVKFFDYYCDLLEKEIIFKKGIKYLASHDVLLCSLFMSELNKKGKNQINDYLYMYKELRHILIDELYVYYKNKLKCLENFN